MPTAGKPASASAAAEAWSHALGRTSGSPGGAGRRTRSSAAPSTSARACASPGQRRGPAPNGRPARSTRTVSPVGSRHRRVAGTRQIIPPDEPGRRLAGLDEDRDARGDDLRLAAGEQVEQPRERRVGAGVRRVRVVGGGDDAGGGDGASTSRAPSASASTATGTYARTSTSSTALRRASVDVARTSRARRAASRSSAGSRSASSASTSARRRAWVSPLAKRETVARSQAIVPIRAGRAGVGDGSGEQHATDDNARDVSAPAETSRA